MDAPIIGIESIVFSLAVSIVLIVYAYLFYPIAKRSFKLKSKNRYNNTLVLILLIIIAVMISLPFSATTYYLFMPLPWYILAVVGALPLIFVIYALIADTAVHEDEFNRQLGDGLDETLNKSLMDTHNFTTKQEFLRKSIHLMGALYIMTWVLEPLVFFGVTNLYSGIPNTSTAEHYYNAWLLFEDETVNLILTNGLVIQFFMIICLFIGNADCEIMRLRFKDYDFPLKKTMQKTRRPTEINDTSASMLLLLGLGISSLILTYGSTDRIAGIYAQMGVICIAVFSDMFAALIGRRWGKHKWKIVPGKSFEGSIAGFLVGFFTAIFFVGWFLALLGALIFVFTDIALDKVKISDNALNPIVIAFVFKVLIFLVQPMIVLLPIVKIWP